MKPFSNKEAVKALNQAKRTQQTIVKKSAKDYLPWFWWGLFVAVFYPPFDFVSGNIWGPIILLASVIGIYLTWNYYRRSKVHPENKLPWVALAFIGVCSVIAVSVAEATQSHYKYAWTVTGLALAVVLWATGIWLKSQGR